MLSGSSSSSRTRMDTYVISKSYCPLNTVGCPDVSSRKGYSWTFGNKVRLVKACPGTGITATDWNS